MTRRLLFDVLALRDWDSVTRSTWSAAAGATHDFDSETSVSLAAFPPERMSKVQAALGRWLGYRALVGLEQSDPFDLLNDVSVVQGFMRQLTYVSPHTARGYVTELRTAVHALKPGQTYPHLEKAFRHLCRTSDPTRDVTSLLVPARDLFNYGFELMDDAPGRNTPLQRATQFRDGLIIAMLIACVVRLKNFNTISIGKHLTQADGRYRLSFPAREVKTKRPLEMPLPVELTRAIDEWQNEYRPEFLSRKGRWFAPHDGTRLWISESGAPYRSGAQLGSRIVDLTKRRFEKDITAHVFRHIAATSIAIEIPEQVGIVMPVLGHSSTKTGEAAYNQASSFSAGLSYLDALERRRQMALAKGGQ